MNVAGCYSGIESIIPFLIIIVVMVAFAMLSRFTQKKREDEINKTLDAIQPGSKVKTIGGICGVVVELCPEDNTFILETGSEQTGKSYIKFDKKAVYQTDAIPAVEEPVVEETSVEESAPLEETETAVEAEPVFEEEVPAAEESVTEEGTETQE